VTNRRDLVRGSLAAAAFAGAGRFIVAPRPATARQGRYDNGIQILEASGDPWLTLAVSDGGSSVSAGGSTLVIALVAVRCDCDRTIDVDPAAIVLRDRHDFVYAPFDATLDGASLSPGEVREGVVFYRLPQGHQANLAYFAPAGRLADIFAWPEPAVAVDLADYVPPDNSGEASSDVADDDPADDSGGGENENENEDEREEGEDDASGDA
jgi:hypothetical protein